MISSKQQGEESESWGGVGEEEKSCVLLNYNRSVITWAVPGLSREVKDFCETEECLKSYLRNVFGFPSKSKTDSNSGAVPTVAEHLL